MGKDTRKALLKLRRLLVDEHNEAVDDYNKGKKKHRWAADNPEDRDRHGVECGYIRGLAVAIEAIETQLQSPGSGRSER